MIFSSKDILEHLDKNHIVISGFIEECMRPSSYLLKRIKRNIYNKSKSRVTDVV